MPDAPPTSMRLAVYARVSSEEQREGQTIDSQIAELERFATANNWQIVRIYKDEGWTGGIMARPELDRLRDDASRKLFDAVLVNEVDRLARDVVHLGVVKRDLEHQGVRVIFCKLPDEDSPTHNLMVNILGSFAEFEREMIIDRTRRGRRHKVEARQQFLGCVPAYGYRYFTKDRATNREGYLEIVPEEASVVKKMFTWVDEEHLSGREVVRRLNAAGIKPRKGAHNWSKSSVLRVLHNEMYSGTWHYNKHYSCEPIKGSSSRYKRTLKSSRRLRSRSEWIPCQLPESLRIIGREQWTRVQKQLSDNVAFSPRHEKHQYMLKSLVRCGACGAMYVGDPCHDHYFYRCAKRCKRCPTVSEPLLNEAVWSEVRRAILNPDLIVKQVQSAIRVDRERTDAIENGQAESTAALAQLKIEEQRVIDAYRVGVLTPADLGRELEKIRARKNAISLMLTPQSAKFTETELARPIEEYCSMIAGRLDAFTVTEQQRFLRTIVKSIIFDGLQARIRVSLPIGPAGNPNRFDVGDGPDGRSASPDAHHKQLDQNTPDWFGRIASTPASLSGHNSGKNGRIADMEMRQHGRNPAGSVEFDLTAVTVRANDKDG